MNRACACFTTDLGYMFPALLSAIQARANLDPAVADVVIILLTQGETAAPVFEDVCRRKNIVLITAPLQCLQQHSAMYARLFLDSLLPEQYSRLLYIDGDVQITAPLTSLIQSHIPAGGLVAVPDPMCVSAARKDSEARAINAYFTAIGVQNSPAKPYFNSGVLLADRPSWAEISRKALRFLDDQPELCRFQDQSALNHAAHAHILPMSFRWNFPIFFRNCGVEANIRPAIYHFMSKPKPWDGTFPPWSRKFYRPYLELLAEFPDLAAYAKPMPLQRKLKYLTQQNIKRLQETFAWRLSPRRQGILTYEAAAKY